MNFNTRCLPDVHPVEADILRRVEDELSGIETKYGVRILYACESGSRGWGFASPDSDYDVRFIYHHRLDWYLRIFPGHDVIELPICDELDINGWELRKTLALLRKGNATLIEWLDSPIVYRADPSFVGALREAAVACHLPERSFYHYIHMAKRNHHEFLRGPTIRLKKYLYVLSPLLACLWIEAGRGPVPMPFEILFDTLVEDSEVRRAIEHLLERKRQGNESETGAAIPEIDDYLNRQLTRLERFQPSATGPVDTGILDRLLMNTVLHERMPGC